MREQPIQLMTEAVTYPQPNLSINQARKEAMISTLKYLITNMIAITKVQQGIILIAAGTY
jgi:hypothetical protein